MKSTLINPNEPLAGVLRLSLIITIILFVYILSFLVKLESIGCDCAKDWRRNYIVMYSVYVICLSVLQMFQPTSTFAVAVAPVTVGLGIMFIIFTLQYVHRLQNEKCACSDDIGRVILYIVAAIDATVFAIVGLLIVISAIMMHLH